MGGVPRGKVEEVEVRANSCGSVDALLIQKKI